MTEKHAGDWKPNTVSHWLRLHLEHELGIGEKIRYEDIQEHVANRRCRHFETLRNERLAMGFVRYESIRGRAPDYLRRAQVCVDLYRSTGNREFLVDAANFLEMEWITPSLPKTYFDSIDGHRDSHHDK